MNIKKKSLVFFIILLTSMFLIPIINIPINLNNENIINEEENNILDTPPSTSMLDWLLDDIVDVLYHDYEYDLSDWWNKTYRYRIGIEIENSTIDRYQPVDIFLTFRENEHYISSARLVRFNYSGHNDWKVIPSQLWNITYWNPPTNSYVKWCSLTFMANVSSSSNRTYFLYFNENLDGIETPDYNTGFSSSRTGDKVTVDIDPPSSDASSYNIEFEEGAGYHTLELNNDNVHSNASLRPEKNSAQLAFLGHFDEGSGRQTWDYSGKIDASTPMNLWDGVSFSTGIKKFGDSCLYFDGHGIAQFPNGYILGDPGADTSVGPFSDQGSYDWTITAWLYPTAYNDAAWSNHATRNCWLSKAADDANDNIEIGINYNAGQDAYFTHLYLQTDSGNTQRDFVAAGANIKLNTWNFVALTYDGLAGTVRTFVDNGEVSSGVWVEYAGVWGGEMNTDAPQSNFSLGATQHGSSPDPPGEVRINNVNYTGYMDEVVIYNTSLSDEEIVNNKDNTYIATIEDITELANGQVMAKYEVNWTQTWDMHISDVISFYYDYSLWNIKRTIYFESNYVGAYTNSYVANGQYNLSNLDNWNNMDAITDNIYTENIPSIEGSPIYEVENYTIMHDEDGINVTVGIFIADFDKSEGSMVFGDVNGTVTYVDSTEHLFSYIPEFPGDFDNSGGGSTNYVCIDLWEYANLTTGNLPHSAIVGLFNHTQRSLQTPINIHVFTTDNFFYNLLVNVTDIDGNAVPGATVTVWNSTNDKIRENETDSTGTFTFSRLVNDTYTINASYSKYGKGPLTITSPKNVILNDTYVNAAGLNITKFENVNLTSITLTCQREDNDVLYEFLENANVTFHYNVSNTFETIGTELTVGGKATFIWQNFTDQSEGTVIFDVFYLGDWRNLKTVGDIDPDARNVSLYFTGFQDIHVNVSLAEFSVTLTEEPVAQKILGETLNFAVNYSYYVGPGDEGPIDGATVYYYIKLGYTKISTQNINFDFDQNGRYTTSIDTGNPPDISFNASVTYTMVVVASKGGYEEANAFIPFTLSNKSTSLTPSATDIEAYWLENITLTVNYQETYPSTGSIDDASVVYSVIQISNLKGSLTNLGSGNYQLELNSTDFVYHGTYNIRIVANRLNYTTQVLTINLKIYPINTYINGKISIIEPVSVIVGTSRIWEFNYSTAAGIGISNASAVLEWQRLVGGLVVESNSSELNNTEDSIYELNFNTELRQIGSYVLVVSIGLPNYVERQAILSLEIIARNTTLQLSALFKNNIIEIVSGNPLNFSLFLSDPTNNNAPIIGATVWMIFQGIRYNFDDLGNGNYSVGVGAAALNGTMLLVLTDTARIYIEKANYTFSSEGELITINIIPISPLGLPLMVWFIIIGVIVIFVGGYGTMKYIQYMRIPQFIKDVSKMRKSIKSGKTIPEGIIGETKMEFMTKSLGDKWSSIGLSLNEILGLKEKKKLAEIKEEPPKEELILEEPRKEEPKEDLPKEEPPKEDLYEEEPRKEEPKEDLPKEEPPKEDLYEEEPPKEEPKEDPNKYDVFKKDDISGGEY